MQAKLAEKFLKTIYLWRRMLTVLLGFIVVVGGVGLILFVSSVMQASPTAPDAEPTQQSSSPEGLRVQQRDQKRGLMLSKTDRASSSDSSDIAQQQSRENEPEELSEKRENREIETIVTPTEDRTSQSSAQTYVVQSGDTLWGIAERSLGSGYLFQELAALNHLSNPGHIEVGQVLSLNLQAENPSPGQITEVAAAIDLESGERTYSVEPGDSLWKIAESELSDPYLWTALYERNRSVIGDNPNLIYPTATLVLPSSSPPDTSVTSE